MKLYIIILVCLGYLADVSHCRPNAENGVSENEDVVAENEDGLSVTTDEVSNSGDDSDSWVPWERNRIISQMDDSDSFGDDARFWFSSSLGFVNWQDVIDATLPFKLHVNESEALIGRAARYNLNPMIMLSHIMAAPGAYGIGDFSRVRIDEKFLTKLEEKMGELNHHYRNAENRMKIARRPNRPSVEAIKMLLEGDEVKQGLFKDIFENMSNQESIKSLNPFVEKTIVMRRKTRKPYKGLHLPCKKYQSRKFAPSHATNGIGKVMSAIDFYASDCFGWGCKAAVTAAHSGKIQVLSECDVRIMSDEGDFVTGYYHMMDMKKQWNTGDYVKAGKTLGYYADNIEDALCDKGESNGPHVHFSLSDARGNPWSLEGLYLGTYQVYNKKGKNYDYDCHNSYLQRTSKIPLYNGEKYCPGQDEITNYGTYWK